MIHLDNMTRYTYKLREENKTYYRYVGPAIGRDRYRLKPVPVRVLLTKVNIRIKIFYNNSNYYICYDTGTGKSTVN
jgi:hypothetical protein